MGRKTGSGATHPSRHPTCETDGGDDDDDGRLCCGPDSADLNDAKEQSGEAASSRAMLLGCGGRASCVESSSLLLDFRFLGAYRSRFPATLVTVEKVVISVLAGRFDSVSKAFDSTSQAGDGSTYAWSSTLATLCCIFSSAWYWIALSTSRRSMILRMGRSGMCSVKKCSLTVSSVGDTTASKGTVHWPTRVCHREDMLACLANDLSSW